MSGQDKVVSLDAFRKGAAGQPEHRPARKAEGALSPQARDDAEYVSGLIQSGTLGELTSQLNNMKRTIESSGEYNKHKNPRAVAEGMRADVETLRLPELMRAIANIDTVLWRHDPHHYMAMLLEARERLTAAVGHA